MERAIKKAIEGGYLYKGDKLLLDENVGHWFVSDGDGGYLIPSEKIFLLDPAFWQALGKSLGWWKIDEFGYEVKPLLNSREYKAGNTIWSVEHVENMPFSWVTHWHRFIDHLAEGKSVDEFFDKLLSN